jgi:hypothetical protein
MSEWQKAQEFEEQWHDKMSTNTYYEETKQLIYAKRMGIEIYATPETPYNFRLNGRLLDIGGGESSVLLKVEGELVNGVVVDPLKYPKWVIDRYDYKGIAFENMKAEDFIFSPGVQQTFDECLIYNTLQHCENPELICKNALKISKLIRVFEWIETGTGAGHIHNLTESDLNKWLGGQGKVEMLNESGCNGRCFYGIFLGQA